MFGRRNSGYGIRHGGYYGDSLVEDLLEVEIIEDILDDDDDLVDIF